VAVADLPERTDLFAGERKNKYRRETEFPQERFSEAQDTGCDLAVLSDSRRYRFEVSRRSFWQKIGAAILLSVWVPVRAQQDESSNAASARDQLALRFLFPQDGPLTLLTGKVEIGQGARILLAQAAAEELRLPVNAVAVEMGDTETCPDDGGTWASLTSPQTVPAVRQAAAFARELFLQLAAERLGHPASELRFNAGGLTAGSEAISFFDLAMLAASPRSPARVELTAPSAWQQLGQSVPATEGEAIVTGRKRYGSDIKRPEMLYATMVRGPHYISELATIRSEPRLPEGARMVRDGDFLGVVANTVEDAREGASRIRAIWRGKELVAPSRLLEEFKETARDPVAQPGARYPGLITRGDAINTYWSSNRRLESHFAVNYIAHVPLETRSAIAHWQGESVTIWYGCQAPFLVRKEVAEAMGIPESAVRVISCDTGAGFGGKQRGEIAIEVARLARETEKPVKLHWNREEEFTAAYFRPAGLLEVRSGATAAGRVQAWEFHNYNAGASGIACHYDIPHAWCGYHPARSPLRQGSYRSLAAVANTFAREVHMGEWAAVLGEDPVEFRLRHIVDERLREAIQRGAEAFGWGRSVRMAGVAQGMACNLEKDARFALFAEVQALGAEVKLRRLLMAFDAGAALNPDNLRNQIEGAVVQGVGGAMFERIDYLDTRIRNARLSRYRVPRFEDVPDVEVLLIDRREIPAAGAGEAPITVVAPAIAAAIHRATGIWVREMPLLPALEREVSGRSRRIPAGG
jgi:nicotinate dehydrogenase subunit B